MKSRQDEIVRAWIDNVEITHREGEGVNRSQSSDSCSTSPYLSHGGEEHMSAAGGQLSDNNSVDDSCMPPQAAAESGVLLNRVESSSSEREENGTEIASWGTRAAGGNRTPSALDSESSHRRWLGERYAVLPEGGLLFISRPPVRADVTPGVNLERALSDVNSSVPSLSELA